jgi:hypothetical protein
MLSLTGAIAECRRVFKRPLQQGLPVDLHHCERITE